MDLPRDLGSWTYETLLEIVRTTEYEPGRFDYKEVLKPTKPDGRDAVNNSICKDVCALANTNGGYLLFGVVDRSKPVIRPEDRVVGIPIDGDLRRHFGDKILGRVQPDVHFDTLPKVIPLPHSEGKGVFVVYVPVSPLRPHMFDWIFWRRGDGGRAVQMTVHEVRDQMMYTEEKLRKLTLLRLEVREIAEVATTAEELLRTFNRYVNRFDTGHFKGLVADVAGLLPDAHTMAELLWISRLATTLDQSVDSVVMRQDTNKLDGAMFDTAMHLLESIEAQCRLCGNSLNARFGLLGLEVPSSDPDQEPTKT